jgi:hypothetical protein
MKTLADRRSISSKQFCEQCGLDIRHASEVDLFRHVFSSLVRVRADQIYPDDEVPDLGIKYSDDLGMFLFDSGLLSHEDHRYDFPMEQASKVGEVIELTLRLNEPKHKVLS